MDQADRPTASDPEPGGRHEPVEGRDTRRQDRRGLSGASAPLSAQLKLFRFVQFELPWELGPADGRYVVRRATSDEPEHVLVLATLGAPQRRLLRRSSSRRADPEPPPAPVSTGRATVIGAEPLEADAAGRWLKAAGDDDVNAALAVLNDALRAHRAASANPFSREVARDQAIAVRVGFGEGEQVAEGRWDEARDLVTAPRQRSRGEAALRPQERFAAILGGRDRALACEELTLRARLDALAGRWPEATLSLEVALRAALAELGAESPSGDLARRVQELGELQAPIGEASATALRGTLDGTRIATVEHALGRLEATLRARSAAGV